MEKFTTFTSRLAPLPIDNIDTDQIIPARFLKTISKAGLGDQLFFDWRYDAAGNPKPDFVLNKPERKAAQILLAGDNFGCGSSREHAPWALDAVWLSRGDQHFVRRHLSRQPLKNSLLPIVIPAEDHKKLLAAVAANPARDRDGRLGTAKADVAGWDERRVPGRRLRQGVHARRRG